VRADPPLRIALVHPHCWPEVRRGGERYLVDLAWYLKGAGHEVHVLTGTDGPSRDSVEDGIVYRRCHHPRPAAFERRGLSRDDTFGATVLPRLLRRRYDVVHALTPTAAIAARLAGQRTVFTVIGHPSKGHLDRTPKDRRLFGAAMRVASRTMALSRASAAAVTTLFDRPCGVLPPGIRLDQFPAELAPRTGPPRVLFSAAAEDRRKGLPVAMAALGRLLERHPDARLQISSAGDHTWVVPDLGADAERLLAATDALGAGALAEIPGRYRAATVTVLPSKGEAFGLALVESLASGTPAVCSRSGGMPEIIDTDEVGRAVPPDDAAALADALAEAIDLAADPATPARCAAHARRWGWAEAVGPMHEDVYREAAR
jgi:glycosyltransferase involved in cell wall biosynthesis